MQRRKAEEGKSAKKWQELLDEIHFTNTDSRYAGRLDDNRGGNIIVTIGKVREIINFNAKLKNKST